MMKKRYVFLRNDDVYKLDDKLVKFCNLCLEYKFPVIYGVIPAKIEDDLVDFLKYKKKKYPHLLDIVQHGWKHKNYSKDLVNKYEFGPKRSYNRQKNDIINGLNRLSKKFNKYFTPAFIPPYNSFDLNTLNIISEVGISIFSGGEKTLLKNKKFLDLPTQISLNRYGTKGTPQAMSLKIMINNLLRNQNSSSILGMGFHHKTLNQRNFYDFTKLILFLNKLKQRRNIKPILFSELLKDD